MIALAATSQSAREMRLEAGTRRRYLELKRILAAKGIRIFTGQTRRTPSQQEKLVAMGRSATKASWHLSGRAVDAYPYDPDTGKPDLAGRNIDLFRTMHREARDLGLKGLAFNADGSKRYITTSKGRIWDGGHLYYPGPHANALAALRAETKIA